MLKGKGRARHDREDELSITEGEVLSDRRVRHDTKEGEMKRYDTMMLLLLNFLYYFILSIFIIIILF